MTDKQKMELRMAIKVLEAVEQRQVVSDIKPVSYTHLTLPTILLV